MPTPIAPHIILSQNARTELQAVARAHSTPQSLALRARIVLRAAELDRSDQPANRPRVGLFQPHGGQMATALSGPGLPGSARCHALRASAHDCLPYACPGHLGGQRVAPRHRIAPSPGGPWMRSWPPCSTLCTPRRSAAQVSGVSCKTLISSPTRVRTGSTATMRTLMPKPTLSASCTPRRSPTTRKAVW